MSQIKNIDSPQNPHFKLFKALLENRGIKKHGQFLMSGLKTVPERLSSSAQSQILATEEIFTSWGHAAKAQKKAKEIIFLPKDLFAELDIFGTHSPLLVEPLPEVKTNDLSDSPQGLEILCAMGDPSNLGAMIRTATALNVSKIILLKEAANPFHPKALRAASGSLFAAPIEFGPSIHDLPKGVLALDKSGESIYNFSWPKDVRLLVGEEGPGLDKSQFDCLSIPINDSVESLNAVAAVNIALFSYNSSL